MKVGAVAAGAATAGFFAKAIMGASDLNEQVSKVGVVFGDQSKQVTDFANQMAKDFGLPKTQILDAAGSIGLIGKASGLSQGDAAKMSTQLAKMAADASSFYNVPLDEALMAIRSGLVGEAEPMRRFGVLLNAQAVDAEAARLGLQKVGKEYTEGAKAQARASLIMKGMTDASGDLERTQGSLSNRLREIKGRAENFAASVGMKVIPLVLKLMDAGEALAKSVSGPLSAAFRLFSNALRTGLTEDDAITPIERVAFVVRDAMVMISDGARKLVAVVKGNLQPILAGVGGVILAVVVPALISLVAGFVAAAAPIVALGALIAIVWPRIKDHVLSAVQAIVGFVQSQWPRIQEIVSEAMLTVQSVIHGVTDVVLAIWNNFGSQIVAALTNTWTLVMNIVDAAMNVIRGVIDVVAGLITGDWGRVWDGIKSIFSGVWDAILAILSYAMEAVRIAISVGWEIVKGIFTGAWDAIKSGVVNGAGAVVDLISSLPGRIISALGHLGTLLWDAGVNLIEGFIGGILSMAKRAASAAWDVVKGAVKSAWDAVVPGSPSKVGNAIGMNFGAGIVQGLDRSAAMVAAAGSSMLGPLTGIGGGPSLVGAGSGSGPPVIVINLNGVELARVLTPDVRDELIRTDDTLRRVVYGR